jgi:hypothetical protein
MSAEAPGRGSPEPISATEFAIPALSVVLAAERFPFRWGELMRFVAMAFLGVPARPPGLALQVAKVS